MATTLTIDPVTRLEGHLKVQVTVDTVNGEQQVVDAKATGTLFRGFETILGGRNPLDAPHFTQRICGVCPVSHGMSAVMTLENAAKMTVPSNARIMRNIVLASNFIQSHILHFYHLSLPDFVDGPAMPPWTPAWKTDKRVSGAMAEKFQQNFLTALDMRRKAHEMGAVFGGKLPHTPAFVPGGFTTVPKSEMITQFKAYVSELVSFISNVYIPDTESIASLYSDYYTLGKGPGNLLAFGVFDQDASGNTKLLRRGRVENGATTVKSVDTSLITEQVNCSWYNNAENNLNPASGKTSPQYPKSGAYSWLKAPRYQGEPYETGPLARMWVNGDYRRGISVMDRHLARAREALKVAQTLDTWAGQLKVGQSVYSSYSLPVNAVASGMTEAARGALGHWLEIKNSVISRYQVITPTCWNVSPRDSSGTRGPLEEALVGTPVENLAEPVEVMRVVHSYDPCMSCAVHVMRPAEGVKVYALGHYE